MLVTQSVSGLLLPSADVFLRCVCVCVLILRITIQWIFCSLDNSLDILFILRFTGNGIERWKVSI